MTAVYMASHVSLRWFNRDWATPDEAPSWSPGNGSDLVVGLVVSSAPASPALTQSGPHSSSSAPRAVVTVAGGTEAAVRQLGVGGFDSFRAVPRRND